MALDKRCIDWDIEARLKREEEERAKAAVAAAEAAAARSSRKTKRAKTPAKRGATGARSSDKAVLDATPHACSRFQGCRELRRRPRVQK